MNDHPTLYSDLRSLIDDVQKTTANWCFPDSSMQPWYRGQKNDCPPLPGILRKPRYNEFEITRTFRNRASSFEYRNFPETGRLDKWLFLMQHYGTPTRLLDWSESLLVSIFIALMDFDPDKDKETRPTVWVLNPHELNILSGIQGLPNTWVESGPGFEHFRLAFHPQSEWRKPSINTDIVQLPIAVPTVMLDARMYAQQSCFIVYGTDPNNLCTIQERIADASRPFLFKFQIDPTRSNTVLEQIRDLGMTFTSIYPDLGGFSRELKYRFSNDRVT